MPNCLFSLQECIDQPGLGGKSYGLAKLISSGLVVSDGFVIPADVTLNTMQPSIIKMFRGLNSERVAVRSSASAEDSIDASWAGQFETILNVGETGLMSAITQCRNSVKLARVKTYDKSGRTIIVNVIVQSMVKADISGVLFTANPVSSQADEFIIEAVHGLGEMLVQGRVIPETISLTNSGKVISRTTHRQTQKLISSSQGTVVRQLSDYEKDSPILQARHIEQLCETAQKIKKIFGVPQDIEWCIQNETLYLLQSRPITTLQ